MQKVLLQFLMLFIGFITIANAQLQQKFWITGTVTGRTPPDTLLFGVHENATFCTDLALGEFETVTEFPEFSFRWVNPRGVEQTFCFGAGRGDIPGLRGVDLRPYISPSQIDTFRIRFYTGNVGFPLFLTWSSEIAFHTDSAKLEEISIDTKVCPPTTINMFTQTSYDITCDQIVGVRIFLYGAIISDVKRQGNEIPLAFALDQNYPNPFNPSTTIRFAVAQSASVSLAVYDVLGRIVATLVSESLPAGYYTTEWKGRDDQGHPVSSGVYHVRMVAHVNGETGHSPFHETQTIVLMK
ncbi:MAG: T9SS type A sorting domain-containing protein [Ignavibacteriae bacterium]|nr:T9SS type A sorting domain-containing protein [Ignavibacteriota bacterium]